MANIDHHFYEALGRDLHRQRMAKKIRPDLHTGANWHTIEAVPKGT